ncbi:glycosyltransferase family 2 protein [Acetobacterium carbinolicum]|uniref:glycosyltransferase family 2 protein n=1 Tax=Acetobacterium carbinolicum TaxID=52690 RepID=UPI0039C8E6A1
MDKLAIVVPCYNEDTVLASTNEQLFYVIDKMVAKGKIDPASFILYIDDGSKDDTWDTIKKISESSSHVFGLKLAGNVGHQNALTAGMLAAKDFSDMMISIDADLQDDTDVIEEMIDKYYLGNDVVYGVRNDRSTDSFIKRTTATVHYKLMKMMGIKTITNHADFRLMSKRAVAQFSNYRETNIYLRGMIPLIGYKTDCVYYQRKMRSAGESKYPFWKMLSLSFEGITSFSIRPISLVFVLGLFIVLCSICAAMYAFASYIMGRVVPGWTSTILSIWFIGGVQLLSIGLIGTYVGKIYMEVKHRPRFNIEINSLCQHKETSHKDGDSI